MTISICMGLYNGEKYIEKQLLSILEQTCPADEVILCDDGSEDDTVVIVRRFLEKHRLENTWHLYCNAENKGYPANFYDAMELCTKDIVFLADQDDLWEPEKIAKMAAVMERHPEISVLACRFGLIDGEGNVMKSFLKSSHGTDSGQLKPVTLHDIFYRYEWPGMVLSYRNNWYREWQKTIGKIPHDIFLCARAAEENAFFQIDETLAYHRRHGNNTAAEEHRIRKLLNKDRKLWEVKKYLEMLEQFEQCGAFRTEVGRTTLQEKMKAMQSRYAALRSGNVVQVIKNALENRHFVHPVTVICDVLIACGIYSRGQ